jgi:biopolymer transport protein ExbD
MKLSRRIVKRGRIEIIPMIDTILIMLIFYMTFSSFERVERQIEAKLPTFAPAHAPPPPQEALDILLHVHNAHDIVVNGGQSYDLESLRNAMLTLATFDQNATVVITADPDTRYQDVIGALDACAEARLTKVAFRPLPSPGAGEGAPGP